MVAERSEVILATRNHGKIAEFRSLLRGMPLRVLSYSDLPELPLIVEDGSTFRQNAEKKARIVAKSAGKLAIADDSGLEVDYIGGKPGVRSSRFCGDKSNDRENNRRVLKMLDGVPWENRKARFVCVICVADPKGNTTVVEGVCNGKISFEMRGAHGFGYDPIFVPDGSPMTMAEMDVAEKNRTSHRAKALRSLRDPLASLLRQNDSSKSVKPLARRRKAQREATA